MAKSRPSGAEKASSTELVEVGGLSSRSILSTILGKEDKNVTRIMIAFATLKWSWNYYQGMKAPKCTTITFTEGDESFGWLIKWIQTLPEARQANSFDARSDRSNGCSLAKSCGEYEAEEIPEYTNQKLLIDLVPAKCLYFKWRGINFEINKENTERSESNYRSARDFCNVTVHSQNHDFLIEWMMELQSKGITVEAKQPPMVFVHSPWFGWRQIKPCPTGRSVIMPDGDYEKLKSDLSWFLSRKDWYDGLSIPYSRGYLLYGIPGSGKTSTVLALAGDLQKNVYVLNISELDDARFMEAIGRVPKNSFTVIEDVDAAFTKREATEASSKLTFSGLLNGLDGILAPEGRVLFMTTNHIDQLDAALIRPGRVDKQIEYRAALGYQIETLCQRFGLPPAECATLAREWHEETISMAVAQERLIQRSHNIEL